MWQKKLPDIGVSVCVDHRVSFCPGAGQEIDHGGPGRRHLDCVQRGLFSERTPAYVFMLHNSYQCLIAVCVRACAGCLWELDGNSNY